MVDETLPVGLTHITKEDNRRYHRGLHTHSLFTDADPPLGLPAEVNDLESHIDDHNTMAAYLDPLATPASAEDLGHINAHDASHNKLHAAANAYAAGGVLGIHVTSDRLAAWRARWSNKDTYWAPGDVQDNSPGDGQRIVAAKNSFVADPPAHWNGSWSGCWTPGDSSPVIASGRPVRDAAFFAMMEQDTFVADLVMDWLDAQASLPNVDFRDDTKFCFDPNSLAATNDGNFGMQEWLTYLLFAYDYARIAGGTWSTGVEDNVKSWLVAGGFWRGSQIFTDMGTKFWTDREALQHNSHSFQPTTHGLTHFGGWESCTCQRSSNNRRLTLILPTFLAGIIDDDAGMIATGKQWAREMLTLWYSGTHNVHVELHRGQTSPSAGFARSEVGWNYTGGSVLLLSQIADALAIRGDTDLYEMSTSAGNHGSEGAKTWLGMLKSYADYGNDNQSVWAQDVDPASDTEMVHRIDGRYDRNASTWKRNDEVMLAQPNLYYDDDDLKAAYLRDTNAGFVPYWPSPNDGQHTWQGAGVALLPGLLFMFGGLEGVDD